MCSRISKVRKYQISESFFIGAVLAVTGGFLDTYTYISRGKVFANAQTGNIVLLGISIAEFNFTDAVRYLIPILAFILGIILSELIKEQYRERKHVHLHWRQIVILVETAVIFLVSMLPSGDLDVIANVAVSFVCSMQVQSFRKVRGNAFATTMCTGNLRSASEHLYHYRKTGSRESAKKSLQYYGIILFFLLGAGIGVPVTRIYHQYAALICCILLLIVFAVMFKEGAEENTDYH